MRTQVFGPVNIFTKWKIPKKKSVLRWLSCILPFIPLVVQNILGTQKQNTF